MKKEIGIVLGSAILLIFISCSNSVNKKTEMSEADSSITKEQQIDTTIIDTNQVSNTILKNIYTRAIEDFIDAIYKKDKTTFDTLYFGDRKFDNPDDFPDITLPEKIKDVNIKLISILEAHGPTMLLYKKTSPIINLMGWVDKAKAEFMFVTFFPKFTHQYDCHIFYNFDSAKADYKLEKLQIEALVNDKEGKPDHFAIFEKGKHIGNRPVNE